MKHENSTCRFLVKQALVRENKIRALTADFVIIIFPSTEDDEALTDDLLKLIIR